MITTEQKIKILKGLINEAEDLEEVNLTSPNSKFGKVKFHGDWPKPLEWIRNNC